MFAIAEITVFHIEFQIIAAIQFIRLISTGIHESTDASLTGRSSTTQPGSSCGTKFLLFFSVCFLVTEQIIRFLIVIERGKPLFAQLTPLYSIAECLLSVLFKYSRFHTSQQATAYNSRI